MAENHKNVQRVPLYIEASDKNDLVRLMIQNNMKADVEHEYFCPMKDGNKWVVWYYAKAEIVSPGIRMQKVS